jgi:excinuclease ABC subunit C
MINAEGELIYVGKSKALRNRLLSYFGKRSGPSKSRRIIGRAKRVVWEQAPHELAALVRELELIHRWRPPYNVRGQPKRRWVYLGLGRGPAPYVYLAARPSPRDQMLFGPVRGKRRYRPVVRALNDCFGLRNCSRRVPIAFSDQLELFGDRRTAACLRYDFGTCLGPCRGACSRREYERRVRGVGAFLRGDDLSLLGRLEQAMQTAAGAQKYERAAALRDTWEELGALANQLQRLRRARRRLSLVYPMPGYDGRQSWWLIRHGQVVAATAPPRHCASVQECLGLIRRVYSAGQSMPLEHRPEDLDMIHLMAAWFRDHPGEMERTLSPEDALSLCHRRACGAVSDGL